MTKRKFSHFLRSCHFSSNEEKLIRFQCCIIYRAEIAIIMHHLWSFCFTPIGKVEVGKSKVHSKVHTRYIVVLLQGYRKTIFKNHRRSAGNNIYVTIRKQIENII